MGNDHGLRCDSAEMRVANYRSVAGGFPDRVNDALPLPYRRACARIRACSWAPFDDGSSFVVAVHIAAIAESELRITPRLEPSSSRGVDRDIVHVDRGLGRLQAVSVVSDVPLPQLRVISRRRGRSQYGHTILVQRKFTCIVRGTLDIQLDVDPRSGRHGRGARLIRQLVAPKVVEREVQVPIVSKDERHVPQVVKLLRGRVPTLKMKQVPKRCPFRQGRKEVPGAVVGFGGKCALQDATRLPSPAILTAVDGISGGELTGMHRFRDDPLACTWRPTETHRVRIVAEAPLESIGPREFDRLFARTQAVATRSARAAGGTCRRELRPIRWAVPAGDDHLRFAAQQLR